MFTPQNMSTLPYTRKRPYLISSLFKMPSLSTSILENMSVATLDRPSASLMPMVPRRAM